MDKDDDAENFQVEDLESEEEEDIVKDNKAAMKKLKVLHRN